MKEIIIREMLDSDIEQCVEVIRSSFMTVAEEFGLTEENAAANAAFLKQERLIFEKDSGTLMFVLCVEHNIVGFVGLRIKKDNDIDIYKIEKLSVLPDYRHHGYGKQLLDFVKEKVNSLGGDIITIGIIEENLRLKKWYEENGFRSTGTEIIPHLPFTIGHMKYSSN